VRVGNADFAAVSTQTGEHNLAAMTSSPQTAAASPPTPGSTPCFSRCGFRDGIIAELPVVVSLFATGLVFIVRGSSLDQPV
jgi:hypothetical protein